MVETIGIVGLGLIGGSLGLALSHADSRLQIMGCDIDPEVEITALEMGCISERGSLKEVAAAADILFLCVPLPILKETAVEAARHLRPGSIITDVASTKQEVVQLFRMLPENITGIAGHPMAGSEHKGIKGADRYLFENAVYVLTPDAGCPPEPLKELQGMIELTGAHVVIMEARDHDQAVAAVSHLPHLVACALVSFLEDKPDAMALAAGGFRDTTRIASGDPGLWTGILLSNRELLLQQIDGFVAEMEQLKQLLNRANADDLKKYLENSRNLRESLPRKNKGLLPGLQEIICLVPDKPGIIGSLGTWLGEKGINIADIEILRVREGDGGSLRIGISSESDSERALSILKEHGVKAWIR